VPNAHRPRLNAYMANESGRVDEPVRRNRTHLVDSGRSDDGEITDIPPNDHARVRRSRRGTGHTRDGHPVYDGSPQRDSQSPNPEEVRVESSPQGCRPVNETAKYTTGHPPYEVMIVIRLPMLSLRYVCATVDAIGNLPEPLISETRVTTMTLVLVETALPHVNIDTTRSGQTPRAIAPGPICPTLT
jgi:hypothetical protein